MRWRDAKNRAASRASRSEEQTKTGASQDYEMGQQPTMLSPSRVYPGISTERIMQAVEQQRRVSQQLEDLRLQQKQRTAFLRTTGLKCIALFCGLFSVLGGAFLLLLIARPDLLERVLDALSGVIAMLLALGENTRRALAQVPLNSWLLSGAALLVVLMMGLWVRLMRYPQEA